MISDFFSPLLTAATAVKILFSSGLVVWTLALCRPSVRKQPARLAPWPISFSDFLACAIAIVGGGVFAQILGGIIFDPLLKRFSASHDTHLVVYGAALQFGLFAGVAIAHLYLRSQRKNAGASAPRDGVPSLLFAGVLTFLAVLPVVDLTGLVWNQFLEWFGLPLELQDLVGVFAHAKFSVSYVVLFLLATVVAPVVEELIFRAGLFRYLRTRLPRWAALLLPALFFAMWHFNWSSFFPLTALAVVFSLAYERTGRIGVTMIAHSLFNLTTILLIQAGVRA